MSSDLSSVVFSAMEDAGISEGPGPESSEAPEPEVVEVSTDDTPGETAVVEGEEAAEKEISVDEVKVDKAAKVDAKPDEELQKLLEEVGLKAPKKGERENRIPHSRVVKMVEKALKRRGEDFTKQIQERDTRLTTAEAKAKAMDQVDALIEADPERYLTMLAGLHPEKYGRFLKAQEKAEEKKAVDDPEPQPDIEYEDKSRGYSPDQFKKWQEWTLTTASKRALAELKKESDKRLEPIERERQQREYAEKMAPQIRARIQRAKETWGEHFPKDNSPEEKELLALCKANPTTPWEAVVAEFCLPKVRESQSKQRAAILKEINDRAKKTPKSPVASGAKVVTNTEDDSRSMQDIVRDSMRAAGM